ncbi:ubiquitin-like protein 7 [Patiria miniata]|uniref:Ubiquitin-like protein 7 n=1 Tax=Patiria miniata TaxID=46514 RepID=A0A914B699_PATMI|nr:ubiquitin-like protein 7 [Patiria miniata]
MANSVGSICVKFSEKTGRTRLDEIDFSGSVSTLRERVSTAIGLPSSELSMVYCGRLLRDADNLKLYGLESGCTVHALRKKEPIPIVQAEPLDDVGIRHLMTALHAALLNPAHRQAVHKILTSTETIDNIITATPGLAADHTAVSMLRDPELLIQIADADNVRRIVRAHPAIGHAVMHVAASVTEEGAQTDRARGADNEQGSLQPDLSDDEMDTSSDGRSSSRPQLITQAQLSAALAAAGVGGSAGSSAGAFTQPFTSPPRTQASTTSTPSASTSSQPLAGSSSRSRVGGQLPGGVITADLLARALQQHQQAAAATVAGTNTSSQAADHSDGDTLTAEQLQVQLQQLRSMGITDDAVSLQALQVTGGNVQAALDLIFEGRL